MNDTHGHVYVLGFSNGCVKVGRTQNTSQRLGAHKSMAGKFGLTITDEWLSPQHAEWLQNEDALKGIAAELGGTVAGKEYYSGITFTAVAEKALGLPFTTPEAPAPLSDAPRSQLKEEDILPLLYSTAAALVLSTPEARLRLRRMCELLDIKASDSQGEILVGYAVKELQALIDDVDQRNHQITRDFFVIRSQMAKEAA